jgi:hypothetical protein
MQQQRNVDGGIKWENKEKNKKAKEANINIII